MVDKLSYRLQFLFLISWKDDEWLIFFLLSIDNSLVVLNRFILLDPLMLFFISATVFSMAHFNQQKRYHGKRCVIALTYFKKGCFYA
jgi:dolichyl-phosphate-mannose--protein O-mannosyl transferase